MNKDGKVESGKCLFSLYEGSNDIWKTDIQTRKKHMKVKSGSAKPNYSGICFSQVINLVLPNVQIFF